MGLKVAIFVSLCALVQGMQPWVDAIPITSVRTRVYKLTSLNSDLYGYFEGVSGPAAPVLLTVFYICMSYVPALLFTALLATCSKKSKPLV